MKRPVSQLSLTDLLIPSIDEDAQPTPTEEHRVEQSASGTWEPDWLLVPSEDDIEVEGDGYQPTLEPFDVVVSRSPRRKKTADARLADGVLEIRIPADCTEEEEQYFIDLFVKRFERSRAARIVDLEKRASELASRYNLPTPLTIRWVSNQGSQWGSCTPSDESIRLSDRMAGFPQWVIDYVIVHELAHLVEGDHSPAFWKLVNAYPKTERARGYLIAKDESS